jgi:hypothetical protein
MTKRYVVPMLVFAVSVLSQNRSDNYAQQPSFREPFTLKLQVDESHQYEEHFDKIPYVDKNDVYLFAGDNFGINVTMSGDEISAVTYQKNSRKADAEFKFSQQKTGKNGFLMLLITTNRLKRRLFFDGFMTIPEKKAIYKTSILPVEPGLSTFESWPHPIVQLVLRNFRFIEKPQSKPEAPKPQSSQH